MTEREIAQSASRPFRIAIVGPCAAGKTTLAAALHTTGFEIRQPAQEHSYVPNMWQLLSQPDLLVYLDVDYSNMVKRRPNTAGGPERLAEQRQRLSHAYRHCDIYVDTSRLTPSEVRDRVFAYLQTRVDREEA